MNEPASSCAVKPGGPAPLRVFALITEAKRSPYCAFDRFDEREVVGVELGTDIAVELLRDRHPVDDVVHVAVIAVDVHDPVRAARRTGELQEQGR